MRRSAADPKLLAIIGFTGIVDAQMKDTALLDSIGRPPRRNDRRAAKPTRTAIHASLHRTASIGRSNEGHEAIVKGLESIDVDAALIAAVKKWVKQGFLNKDIKLRLATLWGARTQIEADLLVQNLMLTADSMGLGAWIHASIAPPVLLGDPQFTKRYGSMLGFDWVTPPSEPLDTIPWHVPLPRYANLRANPIGLRRMGEQLIKASCPPNYPAMSDAVDAVVAESSGPTASTRMKHCSPASTRASSASDISRRPVNTATTSSGARATSATRCMTPTAAFPRMSKRSHVPGIWLQAHHVDERYHEQYFRNGLADAHRNHDDTCQGGY